MLKKAEGQATRIKAKDGRFMDQIKETVGEFVKLGLLRSLTMSFGKNRGIAQPQTTWRSQAMF